MKLTFSSDHDTFIEKEKNVKTLIDVMERDDKMMSDLKEKSANQNY